MRATPTDDKTVPEAINRAPFLVVPPADPTRGTPIGEVQLSSLFRRCQGVPGVGAQVEHSAFARAPARLAVQLQDFPSAERNEGARWALGFSFHEPPGVRPAAPARRGAAASPWPNFQAAVTASQPGGRRRGSPVAPPARPRLRARNRVGRSGGSRADAGVWLSTATCPEHQPAWRWRQSHRRHCSAAARYRPTPRRQISTGLATRSPAGSHRDHFSRLRPGDEVERGAWRREPGGADGSEAHAGHRQRGSTPLRSGDRVASGQEPPETMAPPPAPSSVQPSSANPSAMASTARPSSSGSPKRRSRPTVPPSNWNTGPGWMPCSKSEAPACQRSLPSRAHASTVGASSVVVPR